MKNYNFYCFPLKKGGWIAGTAKCVRFYRIYFVKICGHFGNTVSWIWVSSYYLKLSGRSVWLRCKIYDDYMWRLWLWIVVWIMMCFCRWATWIAWNHLLIVPMWMSVFLCILYLLFLLPSWITSYHLKVGSDSKTTVGVLAVMGEGVGCDESGGTGAWKNSFDGLQQCCLKNSFDRQKADSRCVWRK